MGKSEENEKKCETFFTENLNDEELNQKILEEFFKEAEEIEIEAEEISKSLECEPTEDGFQKLMAEIKRREPTENTNDYVTNVDDREKHTNKVKELKNVKKHVNESNNKQGNTGRKRVVRWASVAAAVLIGVFGISMTSEANRAYIMREMNELFGNDVNTKVNNNEVVESDRTDRYACEEIENTLNMKMPEFFYLPDEMKYEDCNIDKDAQTAFTRYSYESNYVYFMVMANLKNATSLSQNDKGKEIKKISSELTSNFEVTLWEIYENGDKTPTYTISWTYKNIYYELFGKIPRKEMELIAENIVY
ncbi:MAG: DUF4367 domain-containing protein [Bacillota bacterium]|nr:DUF4367 domain-containing protein [Bacillota bacterium]